MSGDHLTNALISASKRGTRAQASVERVHGKKANLSMLFFRARVPRLLAEGRSIGDGPLTLTVGLTLKPLITRKQGGLAHAMQGAFVPCET